MKKLGKRFTSSTTTLYAYYSCGSNCLAHCNCTLPSASTTISSGNKERLDPLAIAK